MSQKLKLFKFAKREKSSLECKIHTNFLYEIGTLKVVSFNLKDSALNGKGKYNTHT